MWRCSASKTDGCNVFITTDDNLNVVLKKGKHTHKKPSLKEKPKHVYFTCDTENTTKKAATPKPAKSKEDKPKTPKKVKESKSEKTPKKKTPKVKADALASVLTNDAEGKEPESVQKKSPSPKKSHITFKDDDSPDNEHEFWKPAFKNTKKARSESDSTVNYNVDLNLFRS